MKYQRKSHIQFRLPNRTYTEEGEYFITICTKNKTHYFGEIIDSQLQASEIATITQKFIQEIPITFPQMILDSWVIMPNHIHLILIISPDKDDAIFLENQHTDRHFQFRKGIQPLTPNSISSAINHFKGKVTKWCAKNGKEFKWHIRFHDHVIRQKESLQNIRHYIAINPLTWNDDCFHPSKPIWKMPKR